MSERGGSMNTDTPRTDAYCTVNNVSVTSETYKVIKYAEQLERELTTEQEKVKRLREALGSVLPKLAHPVGCGKVRPTEEWAAHGSMSFDDCQCLIKTVSATLEATR